jgi:rubrerythrin
MNNNFIIKLYGYIMDEVDGYKDYKSMSEQMRLDKYDNFATTFNNMAMKEKEHAECLIKIISDYMTLNKSDKTEISDLISELNLIVMRSLN